VTLVVGSATLILASWAAVGAQILVREAVEDEGAAPGRAGRDPDGVDREYKSGALPKEAPRARSRLKRAEDHFRRQQWADGLAIVDEVLAETTSPGYRRRRLLEAAKRRRQLDRKLAELEKTATADGQNQIAMVGQLGGAAGQLGGARGPAAGGLDELQSDDERTPTVEVYSFGGVRFRPTAAALRDRLLALPQAGLTVYLRTYEAPAKSALDDALALPFAGSYDALRRVGERFALTVAGRQAWRHLASRLADAGRFEEAAAALDVRLGLPFDDLEDLDEGEHDVATRPQLLSQAALLHFLSGHEGAARRCLREVETTHSETPILVRGEATIGAHLGRHELFRTLAQYAARRSRPGSPWPSILGSYSHGGRAERAENEPSLPALGTEARWLYRLRDVPTARSGSSSGTASTLYRGSHPALQLVSDGELLFLRQGDAIVAIDVRSGRRRWVSAVAPPRQFTTSHNSSAILATASNGREDYVDLGAKTLTLWTPPSGKRALVLVIDHSTQARTTRTGHVEYRANRILAIDSRSGKLRWRIGGSDHRRDPTHGLAFTAPPTPAGDILVAPAIRESGYYLAGIEPGGRLAWLSRLYSFNPTYYQRYGSSLAAGASVAVHDGVAYSVPGNGFVAAAEAATGRLLWMSRYRSGVRERRAGGSFVHSQPIVAPTAAGPVLLAAARDTDHLTAFEPSSGRVLWENRPADSSIVVLGTDPENVYLAGSSLAARSLRTGEEVWSSPISGQGHGSGYGSGFLRDGKIYLPRSGGKLLIASATNGEVLERLTFLDPRVPAGLSQNLFTIDGQLLALGSWGLASVRPQAESWAHLREEPGRRRFEQARLLRSEGEYARALDIFYDLLPAARSKSLRRKLRAEIISAVNASVREQSPAHIDRLLAFGREASPVRGPDGERLPPLVTKRSSYLSWRLRQAQLSWKTEPLAAVKLWAELLREDGQHATSPESNTVDVRIYASDLLRELRFDLDLFAHRMLPDDTQDGDTQDGDTQDGDTQDGDGKSPISDEDREAILAFLDERLRDEDRRVGERIEAEPESDELAKIVSRRSHSRRSAEAGALLAMRTLAAGRIEAAGLQLRRLVADYPALRGVPQLQKHIESLVVHGEPQPRLRGVDTAAADAVPDAERKSGSTAWRQVFWHEVERGILVSGAAGGDPQPVLLTLEGPLVRAVDIDGGVLMERELPDFPDLGELKTRLASHIEEPATAHIRGRRLVLFTAAGCYAFNVGDDSTAPGSGVDSVDGQSAPPPRVVDFDARSFKLVWAQTYTHGLEQYLTRARGFGSRTVNLPADRNHFPEVSFSSDGDPTILHPDGELVRIDRHGGKLLWRFRSAGHAVLGHPMRRGPWYEVLSTAPPGLLRYRPAEDDAGITRRQEFVPGPNKTRSASIVKGVANVFQGERLEVRAHGSERLLWSRRTTSRLVHATPGEVWTTAAGNLKARALRSGRELRKIPLPGSTRVDSTFTQSDVDGDGMTLVCSSTSSASLQVRRYSSASYRTGSKLWIVRLGPVRPAARPPEGGPAEAAGVRERLWATELAVANVTYDGSRHILDDGRWLFAFNAQDAESEKWYTRVVAVDPATGEAQRWIEVEISGKGTGQAPRICPVAGGLAVGNSEGYGWFTTSLPPLNDEADDPEKEDD